MKRKSFFFLFLVLGLSSYRAESQEVYQIRCLNESDLKSRLKQLFYDGKHSSLGYNDARRYMFGYIDNIDNINECIYSGYKRPLAKGTLITYLSPVDTEHIIPRSFFGGDVEPMLSDIHSLAPTYEDWNSLRGNLKLLDIKETLVSKWIRGSISYLKKPVEELDTYSKYSIDAFEPRESKKGDVARRIMYFFTMYPQFDLNNVSTKETLCRWNFIDPVDDEESNRNNLVEFYQGNRNPYIDMPFLLPKVLGCPDSLSYSIVSDDTTVLIGDMLYEVCLKGEIVSSILVNQNNTFLVYTSLGEKSIYIASKNQTYTTTSLEVIDIMGKTIFRTENLFLDGNTQKIDLFKIPDGVYFVRLSQHNNTLYIGKFYI